VRAEAKAFARDLPVRAGTVLYESFAGNGALCNPEAIFRELHSRTDSNFRHIWVLDGKNSGKGIRAEFAADPTVSFVSYRSFAYFRALASSNFLVNNATFPGEFSKRPGQIYLNTWHGTPLKSMGYDMRNGAVGSANTLRNFLSADFLLSQNPFMTEQMYAKAYKLSGIFRGQIIEEGYPRVDHQFADDARRSATKARLEAAGIDLGDREIVLYAPTWKGSSFGRPRDDAAALASLTRAVQEELGSERFIVLVKTHQVVHKFARHDPEFAAILVPNDIPTNAMLDLSAVLVTDYSSIFFDFLATERPLVFLAPDAADYEETRGTYFAASELPGPVVDNPVEAAAAIVSLTAPVSASSSVSFGNDFPAVRADWHRRFTPADDGSSSRRVVDIVFFGAVEGHNVAELAATGKKSILMSLGGMRSNGITSSALNLLNAIDHDRYDVSIVINKPRGDQVLNNQRRINPNVRQFHRAGTMSGSKALQLRRRLRERSGRNSIATESAPERDLWHEEWHRCFGGSDFDALVDFSGYTAFWGTLFLHSPGGRRSIWLHNDLAAEVNRRVGSSRRFRRTLPAVFANYSQFDALVSVSPSLSELNERNFSEKYQLAPERFVSVRNLVDEAHVKDGLAQSLDELMAFSSPAGTIATDDSRWMGELKSNSAATWFVTVGRFSEEKNHARLVRAFAVVHAQAPQTRLIIVGHGPLRNDLNLQIREAGLDDVAFVVGPYPTPFPILAATDCFVLSSNYEGQPMVLLEAAIAGLPIVSVDFGSIRGAVPDAPILVVEQSDGGLAEGMRAYLRGEVKPSSLDAHAYNLKATAAFFTAVLGEAGTPPPTS